jgi:1,4-dihydroxy-6-naphthoate synthase
MFYPLTAGVIDTEGLEIEHVLADIETLNQRALEGTYEVSAVSFHAYPYIADKYLVLPSGGSVGDGYGPLVVAREELKGLKGERVAVPGKLTTAYLVLKLYEPDFEPVVMPFDKVLDAVLSGEVKAGLVIHEGQLSYKDKGLKKVVDLGEWWKESFGLPLPLGGNVVRKDLGKGDHPKDRKAYEKECRVRLVPPGGSPKIRKGVCKGHKRRHRKDKKICKHVCE